MTYKIEIYQNPFDMEPVVSGYADDALEAEAKIRSLTEKYQKIKD